MSQSVNRIIEFLQRNPLPVGYPLYLNRVVVVTDTGADFSINPHAFECLIRAFRTHVTTQAWWSVTQELDTVALRGRTIYVVPDTPTEAASTLLTVMDRNIGAVSVLAESEVTTRMRALFRSHLAYLDQT